MLLNRSRYSHKPHGPRDKCGGPVTHTAIQMHAMNTGFLLADAAISLWVNLLLG
ncbi:hypothetical protein MNBD_GAMMA14-1181, partial [hydrothermal vent metagenome]